MASALIKAETRSCATKSDVKKARHEGKIPGVVYGKKISNERIFVEEKELMSLLKASTGGVIRIELPNYGEQSVMVTELQRDRLHNRILHVDFHQIDMNESVKASVRVELVGEAKGLKEGGILQQLHTSVEIRCLAGNIPTVIEADVSHLGLGEHMSVRDIVPPSGVEIKTDPSDIIATMLTPQKEEPEATREEREKAVQQDAEKALEVAERE